MQVDKHEILHTAILIKQTTNIRQMWGANENNKICVAIKLQQLNGKN